MMHGCLSNVRCSNKSVSNDYSCDSGVFILSMCFILNFDFWLLRRRRRGTSTGGSLSSCCTCIGNSSGGRDMFYWFRSIQC